MEYRIPKKKVKIEMLINERDSSLSEIRDYFIFLNWHSQFHSGEETIEEFLNGNVKFIPAIDCETDKFYAININNIIFIKEKKEYEKDIKLSVRVHFSNKMEIDLNHFKDLEEYHRRPIDYFNSENQFIVFLENKQKIYINKFNVTRFIEL